MDYTKSYTAAFYAAFLDPVSWIETGEKLKLVSGNISRTDDGLRHTASLVVRGYDETVDRWARIYMDSDQNGNRAHEALFTGIISTPDDSQNNAVIDVNLQLYSSLKAAEDIDLDLGWYVPAGANLEPVIRELMRSQPAPVFVDGTMPRLEETLVAEQNENCLTMTNTILDVINWRLQIEGDGTLVFSPKPIDPVMVFSAEENDVVKAGSVRKQHDYFEIPNVLRATSGDNTAVVRDEQNINARGREITATEDNVSLTDNESITEYALRRMTELQTKTETVSYNRRYLPEVKVGDMIEAGYKDVSGRYIVTSQSFGLTPAAETSETVKREI